MPLRLARLYRLLVYAAVPALFPYAAVAEDAPARVQFNRQIRAILSDNCFACHGPDANQREADLRIDTAEGATADLGERRAIAPGKPDESELLRRIAATDADQRMPPADSGKQLSEEQIELIRRWIAEGAEYQPHWAYLPPRRSPVPEVNHPDWPAGPIDRFLLHRLEQEGLSPSPVADPITLCRRLYFDLTGLPPSPDEAAEFMRDPSDEAYAQLVERLLASPHYGERMAMYWLDLVRYANTVGYHGDQEHAISPYRDYVIKAFNENLPFDHFTAEQLAGDLLASDQPPEAAMQQRIASGYNRLLQTSHEGGVQKKEYLHKYDADRVRNFSGVWLGATMGCAECHDHKYDPFTQRDFYSLAAFFADVDDNRTFKGGDTTPTKREPEIMAPSLLDPTAPPRRTMVAESVAPRTLRVLHRGDWMDDTGEIVAPAVPAFLPPLSTGERRATRLDLARWLTSAENPLTARVFVNRVWYLLFGVGLAPSLEDFGAQGEWPTHPELLDWLAVEFRESGWDVKHLVRLIVSSRAYRQSSLASDELRRRDPENRLFARQSAFRLPAETIRDSALKASGLLVLTLGGDTSHPYQPADYYQFLNFPKRKYQADRDANQYRRGVYMHWQRQFLHPMLKAFDAPSREECTVRRPQSNTPLGALTLLNDPSFIEAARAFAARILSEASGNETERIRWAWRTVLSREPSDAEIAVLERLQRHYLRRYRADPEAAKKLISTGLTPQPAELDPIELAAWTSVVRAIFNLHETITRS